MSVAEKKHLIKANIDNLRSLWRVVGKRADAFSSRPDFDAVAIDYSQWPNKIWFKGDVSEESVRTAKEYMQSFPFNLGVSYWDVLCNGSDQILERNGFVKSTKQYGMCLKLSDKHPACMQLNLKEVSAEEDAVLWEDLFMRGFEYKISSKLLYPKYKNTQILIAYHKGTPIGTAMTHGTDNKIFGIHSMSILPEKRRKGYASELMGMLLNQGLAKAYSYATLQASEMGKGLYSNLGFEEQFRLQNYHLSNIVY